MMSLHLSLGTLIPEVPSHVFYFMRQGLKFTVCLTQMTGFR